MLRAAILLHVGLLAVAACSSKPPRVGTTYAELDSLQREMPQFIVLGQIAEQWPARVVRVQRGKGGVKFELRGSVPQVFEGFGGYRLVAVILAKPDSNEMAVVFRSAKPD